MSEKELSQEDIQEVNSIRDEDEERFLGYMREAAQLAFNQTDKDICDSFVEKLTELCEKYKSPINIKNAIFYVYVAKEFDNMYFGAMSIKARRFVVQEYNRFESTVYQFDLYSF